MSDYILLQNPNVCPNPMCRTKRQHITGFCHNCGVKLFATIYHDFKRFEEETGIVNWWAYDVERGWMFRDHFMIERRELHRELKIDKRVYDKDYGRQTTPEAVSAKLRKRQHSRLPVGNA